MLFKIKEEYFHNALQYKENSMSMTQLVTNQTLKKLRIQVVWPD